MSKAYFHPFAICTVKIHVRTCVGESERGDDSTRGREGG